MFKFLQKTKNNPPQVPTKIQQLTLSEFMDVVFFALPYINLIKRIKSEYNSNIDGNLFRFIVKGLLSEMEKEDIYTIFSILLRIPKESVSQMSISELTNKVPQMITDNNLLELYTLAKYFRIIE